MMKKFILSLIGFLKSFVSEFEDDTPKAIEEAKEEVKDIVKKKTMYRNKAILLFASGEIGEKEVVGEGNNRQVLKYHAYAREDNDMKKAQPDSVPWCASFVCYILEANPYISMSSMNSMQARSFLKWGLSSKKKPMPGDIVVFWRGSVNSWKGHVGFYLGETENYVYCLGGNQNDSVCVSRYMKDKILDIRRSSLHETMDEVMEDELFDLADKVIAGEKIDTTGKVN